MDLAFVSDVSYPWKKGGAEKRIHEIAKRLKQKHGHKVTIYTMHWWRNKQKEIKRNGINYVSIMNKKELYKKDRRSITEALFFGLNTYKISNQHDVIDFNVFPYIHCCTGKLRTLLQKNMVITWHEVWGNYWYSYLGKKGFFGKLTEKIVSKLPQEIIAVSEKTKNELKELGAESTVVPNGINYKEIQEIKEKEESFDAIYVGRLIPEKNVDQLLKAIEDTDYSVAVIGDGPMKKELLEYAEKNDIDACFFGETSYEDLIGYIKSSRVFVLPSSREGFGITVVEAMASGTPVLTVDEEKNAAKDLVNEERGLVVSLNPNEIRDGIDLLINKKEKKDLTKNAKVYSKQFDWDNVSRECLDVYRSVLE